MPLRKQAKPIVLVVFFIFPPLLACVGLWARQEAHLPLPPRGRFAILCITELGIRQYILKAGRDEAPMKVHDTQCRKNANVREVVSLPCIPPPIISIPPSPHLSHLQP